MTKTAFLFPGQGSQTIGMGASFLDHPKAKELFATAKTSLGFDLQQLCLSGPSEALTATENAQPAILTVSTIALEIFKESYSITPASVAGHSLGEYTALVSSGVLDFKDAVKIVHNRGKFMQAAAPKGIGAMAAILGKKADELEALCIEVSTPTQVVKPANYNCPGQIVVSGHLPAVERLLEKAKGKMLAVSAPFHSDLMLPAAEKLRNLLETISFKKAQVPVISNLANQEITEADFFLPSLVGQVCGAVKWETGIRKMIENGVTHFIEFGQGKALGAMMKRIDKSVTMINIQTMEDLETNKELLSTL